MRAVSQGGDAPLREVPWRGRRSSVRVVAYGLVAALAGLLLVTALTTAVTRYDLSQAESQLRAHWLPAQTAALSLESAYVDEETGQRGYMLTGETRFLEPFVRGQASAIDLETRLRALLRGDHVALRRLAEVHAAHVTWQELADAQIAARRAGPLPQARLTAMTTNGKQRFDALRQTLTALTDRTSALANAELDRIASARDTANLVTALAAALAVVVAVLAVPALRRVLTRPLGRLLGRVQEVAGGAYEEAIPEEGPAELATIAAAVDRMRQSILSNAAALVDARHELTLHDERERIAADLHDLTIQRVFALGLSLSAASSRNREAAPTLAPLIDETDRIIRELRGIIFDVTEHDAESIRSGIAELVREGARVLGFVPVVAFRGSPEELGRDVAEGLLAVLHEALSNVARHARATRVDVGVVVTAERVVLTVADDGRGLEATCQSGDGTRNMEARARRLGGTTAISGGPAGGTTVEWQVPLVPAAGSTLPAPRRAAGA